ncbi:MAG TPA: NAD-dependent epimerase/dehydratase family protein [Nocardioidaceae bacterium]|nr:NAD-dependent epimerase/dehydratase family protein [Nocardioidaceae bacterium]
MTVTWVVGAGGLLGRHVARALQASGHVVVTQEIPWHDAEGVRAALRAGAAALADLAAGGSWSVAWCAGAGVVATPQEDLDEEVEAFRTLLDELAALPGQGALFLASSAGGVYAGSPDVPPYTEESQTRALAPYGVAKLAMEEHATSYARDHGLALLIGRISNLYGPGQNLGKPQGLVSLLCQAELSRQPVGVYVSLDTLRDYLFVEDAAAMVVACLDRLSPGERVTKILASGRATSIAALVGEATKVFRRRPPLVFRGSASSSVQVRDLRLTSVVWTDLDVLARTPLPVGLAATGQSVARAMTSVRV